MPAPYDLLILGAGPAGSAAALIAALAGLRCAVVDKARFPRDKLCGGLLTGRSLRHLTEIGSLPPADVLERHDTIAFHRHGRPLGEIAGCPPVHLTMRRRLDAHLLERAGDAGAEILCGRRPTGIEGDRVTLDDGRSLAFRTLIGADGVNSPTARHLFGAAHDPAKIGFALEIENPPEDDRRLRVDFDAVRWGYGWRFPKAGSTTIGIGGLQSRNPAMKTHLAGYLAQLGTPRRAPVKGHHLPFGDFRRHPGRANVLLAGDAAGLVDPITGEGIAHALDSGRLAALACRDALAAGDPAGALTRYTAALRPIHRALSQARLLRPLVFSAGSGDFFARAFEDSRSLKHHYMALLAGEAEYPDILRRTLLRLPRRLWRHGVLAR
ncbi:geranylgeranyl reductase family protein [Salipiger mucosus]|uniref:Geranylgeranyl reductase n=1 Tax=Salipiger mucosus DSM 16094 TaxID=1123237 RepID=S9R4T4_9RHOB|nr:geranylgeranyl reductase family protein [Salipiger mucosus]EPX86937.1 Geranylgeranyl reductase [Salipiger mucosus DSM 16094]